MIGCSRWLAVLTVGAALAACHAGRPAAAKPSLWLVTMTSSENPTPWVRRECQRPRERYRYMPEFLRPIFVRLVPHPCSPTVTKLGDGSSVVRSSCKLPRGTIVATVSEASADGRSTHTRTVFQHPAEAPIWDDITSVRLGDCPVAMRPDQYAIWLGADGKVTDPREEQEKLPTSGGRGQGDD
jgi:hypothetical protein